MEEGEIEILARFPKGSKKKEGVITLSPPMVWPKITLPTRILKSVT